MAIGLDYIFQKCQLVDDFGVIMIQAIFIFKDSGGFGLTQYTHDFD